MRFLEGKCNIGRHILVTVMAFAIVGLFAGIIKYVKPLNPISNAIKEFSFTDIYYSILSSSVNPDTSRVITIVDLTNLHKRGDIAKVLLDIESCHPKVVGCDCVFEAEFLENQSIEANDSLVQIADEYKNITWATRLYDYSMISDSIGYTRMQSSFFKQYVNINEGSVNMPRGSLHDSMKRKVPMYTLCNGIRIPTLCANVADLYAGKNLSNNHGELLKINFSPTVFNKIQPEDIINNRKQIEGQIVLFGTLTESNDMHWTPLGRIAGVEVIAYGIQTLLENKAVRMAGTIEMYIVSFLIVLLVQIMQAGYLSKTHRSNNLVIRFIFGSSYVLGILTFLLTSVFMLLGFLTFKLFNVSYSLGLALSVIAFLDTSRSLDDSLKKYYLSKMPKKQ